MNYLNKFLFLVFVFILISIFSVNDNFRIIACDVGQGDATLITYKSFQILVDGGPDNSVLTCLGKYIPIYDREIELVIATHPQADHYTGLIEVLRRYKVDNFMKIDAPSSNQGYQLLEKEVGSHGVTTIVAKKGMSIRYDLIYLDILNPEEGDKNSNVNNLAVVGLVRYKDFEALLTADVENKVSDLLATYPEVQDLDYIKVNHHGSRNGMTENLLKAVKPKIAVISCGVKNRFGHPHKEILDLLKNYNIETLRTDEMGDVVVVSNGIDFWVQK